MEQGRNQNKAGENRKHIKNYTINLLLSLLVCSVLFGVLELFLRVYKPFEFRMKGNKIILPVNKKYIIENNEEKFDKKIIHTKNTLGFRGEEMPEDFEEYLTIITIGGSTTECFHTSDGKTWTDILGNKLKDNFSRTWINNAGLDGQSTRGHIILMEDYIINITPQISKVDSIAPKIKSDIFIEREEIGTKKNIITTKAGAKNG